MKGNHMADLIGLFFFSFPNKQNSKVVCHFTQLS